MDRAGGALGHGLSRNGPAPHLVRPHGEEADLVQQGEGLLDEALGDRPLQIVGRQELQLLVGRQRGDLGLQGGAEPHDRAAQRLCRLLHCRRHRLTQQLLRDVDHRDQWSVAHQPQLVHQVELLLVPGLQTQHALLLQQRRGGVEQLVLTRAGAAALADAGQTVLHPLHVSQDELGGELLNLRRHRLLHGLTGERPDHVGVSPQLTHFPGDLDLHRPHRRIGHQRQHDLGVDRLFGLADRAQGVDPGIEHPGDAHAGLVTGPWGAHLPCHAFEERGATRALASDDADLHRVCSYSRPPHESSPGGRWASLHHIQPNMVDSP